MELNLISVVHSNRKTKKAKITKPGVLLLLMVVSTFVFYLITGSASNNHVQPPLVAPVQEDVFHTQVTELTHSPNTVDRCDVLQNELKIFGKVVNTASAVVLLHQISTDKLFVLSTENAEEAIIESEGGLRQIDDEKVVIRWRGCDFAFSY